MVPTLQDSPACTQGILGPIQRMLKRRTPQVLGHPHSGPNRNLSPIKNWNLSPFLYMSTLNSIQVRTAYEDACMRLLEGFLNAKARP